jgi:hypothetical protein
MRGQDSERKFEKGEELGSKRMTVKFREDKHETARE